MLQSRRRVAIVRLQLNLLNQITFGEPMWSSSLCEKVPNVISIIAGLVHFRAQGYLFRVSKYFGISISYLSLSLYCKSNQHLKLVIHQFTSILRFAKSNNYIYRISTPQSSEFIGKCFNNSICTRAINVNTINVQIKLHYLWFPLSVASHAFSIKCHLFHVIRKR